jgi:hypothetical protein
MSECGCQGGEFCSECGDYDAIDAGALWRETFRDETAREIAKVSASGANRSPDAIARFAYDVADAMLTAREQTREQRQALEKEWRASKQYEPRRVVEVGKP